MDDEVELRSELADDGLDPGRLAEIAYECPDLRAEVAAHPAAYEGLLEWLGDLGDDDVDAALRARTGVDEETPVPPLRQPSDEETPVAPLRQPSDEETVTAPLPASFDHQGAQAWPGPVPLPDGSVLTEDAGAGAAVAGGAAPGTALAGVGAARPVPESAAMAGAPRGRKPGLVFGAMAAVGLLAVAVAFGVRLFGGGEGSQAGALADGEYVTAGKASCPRSMTTFYSASLPSGGSVCTCGTGDSPSVIVWVEGEDAGARSVGLKESPAVFDSVTLASSSDTSGDSASGELTYCGQAAGGTTGCLDGIANTFWVGQRSAPSFTADAQNPQPCEQWQQISANASGTGSEGDSGDPRASGNDVAAQPGDPGAYGVPLPEDTAEDQVRYLAQIIEKSKQARATLVDTVASLNDCSSSDYSAALARIQSVTQNRQELLTALDTTPVDKVPNGDYLLDRLKASLRESLAADQAFERWTSQIIAHGCPAGDSDRKQAVKHSDNATKAKTQFCKEWNSAIAPTFGQAEVSVEKL